MTADPLDRFYGSLARRRRWERYADPQDEPLDLPDDDDAQLFPPGDPIDDLDPSVDYSDRDHYDRARGI